MGCQQYMGDRIREREKLRKPDLHPYACPVTLGSAAVTAPGAEPFLAVSWGVLRTS